MNYEHGGNIWTQDPETGIVPRDILDFSVNLNPLGPPGDVLKLLRKRIGFINYYPESRARTLRLAAAGRLGLSGEQVIVGNGASELISLFFWVLRPKKVLVPAPAYGDYARAALCAGSRVENLFFMPDGFVLSREAIAGELSRQKPDALVFCNPNNPTGAFWDDITPLLEEKDKKTSFLLDASFLPFTGADWPGWLKQDGLKSCWSEREDGNGCLFLVLSLTKIFALPGLRLGIGIGPPALIKKMEAARDPWSVNSLAQLAGLQCLREEDYLAKSLAVVERERQYLYKGLKNIPGLKPFPSRANFLLVNCRQTGVNAAGITEALAGEGIHVRNADNFTGLDDFYLRVAVKKRKENFVLIKTLRNVVK